MPLISNSINDGIIISKEELEPSYYATRTLSVFREVKGNLQDHSIEDCLIMKFLKSILKSIIDSIIECYSCNKKGITKQSEFDFHWIISEFTKEFNSADESLELIKQYIDLMKINDKEKVLKEIFSIRNWTYNASCSIIHHHPTLCKEDTKEILQMFQVNYCLIY